MNFAKLTILVFCLLFSSGLLAQKTKISITIDDLPLISTDKSLKNQQYVIDQLIKHGKSHDAALIGFVNEGKLFQDSTQTSFKISLLEKWLENGFQLGNHGHNHLNYDKHDTATYFNDILTGEMVSKELSKKYNSPYIFYRHPFLHAGDTPEKEIELESFLRRSNYKEAPVTVDNSDWIFARAYDLASDNNEDEMKRKIAEAYVPYMVSKVLYYENRAEMLFGRKIDQVLLIHANRINADLLGDLLIAIKSMDYEFALLSDVLEDTAYESNDHIAKPWGISWIQRWARNKNVISSFYRDEPKCPQFVQEYSGLSE